MDAHPALISALNALAAASLMADASLDAVDSVGYLIAAMAAGVATAEMTAVFGEKALSFAVAESAEKAAPMAAIGMVAKTAAAAKTSVV